MGTPCLCMTLYGVGSIGSNVLKKVRDTSTWRWEAWKAPAGHKAHRNSSCSLQNHRRFSPAWSLSCRESKQNQNSLD